MNVNKKKKVLHFLITDAFSGAESVAAHIIKDLPEDWEGYYVSPRGMACDIVRDMGLNVIECNTSSIREVKRVVKEIKPDAIHAHDCRMSFICALAGLDFTAHFHQNWPWMGKICPKSVSLIYACLRAKRIICVSESVRDGFIFKASMGNKVTVVRNTVDKEKILRLAEEDESEKYDICMTCRITGVKEPLRFVETVAVIKKEKPDIKAVMLGDGDLRKETEEKIAELGLEDNICMKGYVLNPYKYMKNSKVGVLTSSVEGFGLVAVEAMLLGLPFVAYPIGGLPGIITPECGLLVNSIDEMKDEILKLLCDADYYTKKSAMAKKRAELYTDRKSYIDRILNTYER